MNTKVKIGFMVLIIFSFLLYAPPLHPKILDYGEYDCCNLVIHSSQGIFEKPSFLNTLRKITSPFNLNYYNLYLRFNLKAEPACYLVYPDSLTYELDGQIKNLTKNKSELIKTIKIDEPYNITLLNFTYKTTPIEDLIKARNITVPEGQEISSIGSNFTVGEEVTYSLTAKMSWWDALGNMIIFILFWLGVFLIFFELNKIKE